MTATHLDTIRDEYDIPTMRDEYDIPDFISDDVMATYALILGDPVDWDRLEENFIGTYPGLDENEAVGNWCEEIHGDSPDLTPFSYYIDWSRMGHDTILNGDVWVTKAREWGQWYIFFNN